jgi:hypothetical protein
MMGAHEIKTILQENLWLTQVISRSAEKVFQVFENFAPYMW